MSIRIRVPNAKLGVPDLLLEVDRPGDNVALWILEVGFLQTDKDLMKRPYRRPKDTLELVITMKGRDVLTKREWKVMLDNPAFGSVMSSAPHPWVMPLTIKVKAWLCHSDGEFSLNEMNSSSYYVCAEICPTRDSTEIAHLNSVFRQAMKFIHDKTTSYVQEHCELDEENIIAMCKWIPPDPLFDWDKVMNHVCKGVMHDGFDRYSDWHEDLNY
ncbi:uncharacterized protein EDB91DRAFT_1248149 [Suillus paluster]|uniref:uncharacterized protein n=1 Tax=Suillus paluster TaxID=48578 RepID=UPI001B863B6A|nr:uncharacterized protein EDB91DRAFT_1248149 [Suillus paluster]KAG1740754.1 hypothetical protein EDB91DRAFT_1248149 [Suillus paluster]